MNTTGFLQTNIPPDWTQMTPERAKSDILTAMQSARENIEAIKKIPDKSLTFENTSHALDTACVRLDRAWIYLNHLESVMTSQPLRDAVNELTPAVSDFFGQIHLDSELFAKISTFAKSQAAKNLDSEAKILLDEQMKDFLEEGALLDAAGKKRLLEINRDLSLLGQKFSENELDSTKEFFANPQTEEEVRGIPQTALDIAAKTARERGLSGWVFTLDRPSYAPVMSYAENDALREKMWRAACAVATSGKFDNRPIIAKILALRDEKAKLLGFKNYADYTLSRRMAQNGDNALKFVNDLHSKFEKPFKREWERLEQFAKKSGCEKIKPWQSAYFVEKLRKEKYDFDPEQLRDYLPFNAVLGGVFKVAKTLYGLDIKKADSNAGVWHESVEVFDIFRNGRLLGKFYTDFVPRKQKRSGAWMNLLSPALEGRPALGVIAGNLTEPSAHKPAFLSFDDAATLFHEFGHLLHFMLMNARELSLRDVAWDFVELPSQIMENWCADKRCLDLFAAHWRTGEKIPDALFEKFKRSEKFAGAMACMRQLSFAKIDLLLHINTREFLDAPDLEQRARGEIADCVHDFGMPVPTILPRFSHIFGGGYAAAYYSYKWAEVLDADAFTRFQKEGILNPEVGNDFAEKILEVGKTVPPETAFENFMGRPPNADALVRRSLEPDLAEDSGK